MKTQRPLRKDSQTELFIKYIVNNGGKASVEELNRLLPKNVKYKANFYLVTKDRPYHAYFKKNEDIDMSCLSKAECIILDEIIDRFAYFTGKDIKEYMHKEIAYTNTKMYDIIPFSLAKEIRDFN